jgi:hypothetical protein
MGNRIQKANKVIVIIRNRWPSFCPFLGCEKPAVQQSDKEQSVLVIHTERSFAKSDPAVQE